MSGKFKLNAAELQWMSDEVADNVVLQCSQVLLVIFKGVTSHTSHVSYHLIHIH